MHLLWNALICLLWPLLYFYRPFRGTLRQRLGHFELGKYDPGRAGLKVLINAVSAGEVNAIAPFIRELRKLRPEMQVALLTTTDSGLEMARTKLTDDVELVTFFPLIDLPFASRRFLDKLRPDLYITTEAELWPNIQAQCRRRGIKTALVNGRLYMHNKAGWRGTLARRLLGMLDLIVCQDERQRANFQKLGVAEDKLTVSGNIKFDFDMPEWGEEQLQAWRSQLGLKPGDRVVVAGSTHEGEEELIAKAVKEDAKLVIVPRHIDRASQLKRLLSADLESELQSEQTWQRLLVDRYGALVDFYRIADVVVMGGTFSSRVGGHNLLEATGLGKPVILGPYTYGITSQVEMLDSVGGVVHVAKELAGFDSPTLALDNSLDFVIDELLHNGSRASAVGQAALEATLANRGAAARAAQQVLRLVAP